jgi:hypothetical protein
MSKGDIVDVWFIEAEKVLAQLRARATEPELDDNEIEQLLRRDAGLGLENVHLYDRAFWRDWSKLDPLYDTWVHTQEKSRPLVDWLEEIYNAKDPSVLLPLIFDNPPPPETRPYFEALFAQLEFRLDEIDLAKVLLPLIFAPPPPETRPHFEALFKLLAFKRRGKQAPSHRPTEHEQKLLGAWYDVKYRGEGVKQEDAIKAAAKYWGVDESAVKKAVRGKHTALRRRGWKIPHESEPSGLEDLTG